MKAHSHMTGFVLILALKQRLKATWKWSVWRKVSANKYRKIPLISPGPIQLCNGFWVGLQMGELKSGIKKSFLNDLIRNR